jgi:hypothetical protein
MLNRFLSLPILRRSYEQYYAEHDRYVAEQKPEIEEQWGRLFETLERTVQFQWEDRWFWPPWLHNDIIGFLEIGSDRGRHVTGDIYLMRKCFPRESRERAFRRYDSPSRKQHILYYREIPKIETQPGNNESYVLATKEIVKVANQVVRKRVRTATIWLPDYALSCLDMAEADRQMNEARKEKDKRR